MGMRLIDADDLAAKIMMEAPDFMDGGSSITKAFILAMVKTRSVTPTIDAAQVVRCKDCKHVCLCDAEEMFPDMPVYAKCTLSDEVHEPSWFCADGERKSADEILMEEMDADPLG